MNLYKECEYMVNEALEQIEDFTNLDHVREEAQEFLHLSCDGHEDVIYYHKAIKFCSEQNTDAGEAWLEDCDGIVQDGDSFGSIACRIAFATLLVTCEHILEEKLEEMENNNG